MTLSKKNTDLVLTTNGQQLPDPYPLVEKSGVEKSGVVKFMVEKSGVESSGVEAWG